MTPQRRKFLWGQCAWAVALAVNDAQKTERLFSRVDELMRGVPRHVDVIELRDIVNIKSDNRVAATPYADHRVDVFVLLQAREPAGTDFEVADIKAPAFFSSLDDMALCVAPGAAGTI